MIKFRDIQSEQSSSENIIQLYHGGTRWSNRPEVRGGTKGRYEGGVGIYLTNKYLTARKYAKGGKVVHLVDIDKNFKDISDVNVSLNGVVGFLKQLSGLKRKQNIISDIINYSKRTNRDVIPVEILNNLIVNYEAGSGQVGLEIVKYFISLGIDASVQHQSGNEDWLIVFNPKIIKNVSVVDPSKLDVSLYDLPQIIK